MLSKIKAYFFIAVAFIATAMTVTFRFQLLKNQAKKAEEKAAKAVAETKRNRSLFKDIQQLEKVQQEDMHRILHESKQNHQRDYFSRKKGD